VAQVWLNGQVANMTTQALEDYDDAKWGNYAIPMTQKGQSETFVGDFPVWLVTAARYSLFAYEVVDSTPQGDKIIAGPSLFEWPAGAGSAAPTVADINAGLSAAHGAGAWGGGGGGADPATIAAAVWAAAVRTLTTFLPPPPSWFVAAGGSDLGTAFYKTTDTLPIIQQTLLLPAGVTSLAGVVVTFVMRAEDALSPRISAVATHVSDDPPVVSYSPTSADFAVPGTYLFEWRCVRTSDGKKFTMPGAGRGKIVIEASL
jgi:hypothetical protein